MRQIFTLFILFFAFDAIGQNARPPENHSSADTLPLRQFLIKNAGQLRITSADAQQALVTADYTDVTTGIRYVYLQQTYLNTKVFNQILSIAVKAQSIQHSSGRFVTGIASKAGSAVPVIGAEAALVKAARHIGLVPANIAQLENRLTVDKKIIFSEAGIAKRPIEAELLWVMPDEGKTVQLAWNINIDMAATPDWWNIRIDAITGAFISKDNWTVYENKDQQNSAPATKKEPQDQKFSSLPNRPAFFSPPTVTSASYNVIPFPYESPVHHAFGVVTDPWLAAGASNNAVTNGWHFDGTTNHDSTRGNNVHAYLDAANRNSPGPSPNFSARSTTAIPTLTFNSTPNLAVSPATTTNRNAAVTNLFYWNNLMHDVMYQYGFTEAAGNFQNDNIGRGGKGNDYVRAEAQDGGGTSNANFSTPADGTSGRMQMYLFSAKPVLQVTAPAAIAGNYFSVESNFSTANKIVNKGPVTGRLIYYNDDAAGTTHFAGAAATNAAALAGNIALIDRGNFDFITKVKNAQAAGAKAAIIINNVAGTPITMGGADNTITIPAVMISQADGAKLAAQLANTVTLSLSQGVALDGDLDNGIITHEYGHGISHRLTGGPAGGASCLSNVEQGDEGWSDYFGLMMTTDWSAAKLTDGTKSRSVGSYAQGEPASLYGLRTYPYTTDMTINPHTYADIKVDSEVHYIGEIWCSALWDMTWNIIQQTAKIDASLYNSAGGGGNTIALNLVMMGEKIQACSPGFLDSRDAILAADSILYNNIHKCAIWNAFARRGMGVSAVQGSSNATNDQTAAFDVPSSVRLTKNTTPLTVASGSEVAVSFIATCECQPVTGYTIRDTIPAGFSFAGGSGSASGNIVTISPVSFTTPSESKTFAVILRATVTGCGIAVPVKDDRDSNTLGGFTPAIITGKSSWITSTTKGYNSAKSWYAPEDTLATDFVLAAAPFTASPVSVFSFWHYFNTEKGYDGGRVEYSVNNGSTWNDAQPFILQNSYNTIMDNPGGAPWTGKAFSGTSNGQFINTLIDFSSFSGQPVLVRFHAKTDIGNAAVVEGWYVDNITLQNGCGGVSKAGLYNTANAKIDSVNTPVFVLPSGTVTSTADFIIVPNPARSQATVLFSNSVATPKINVYDISGKLVISQTVSGVVTSANLNVTNLPAGIYTVRVVTDTFSGVRKLAVQR